MEQKKRGERATLTQVKALEAELAKAKESYRLQLIADKHLEKELEAVKLKLKRTTEQLYEVAMKNGSVIKVSDGYRREEVEILQDKLDKCEKELASQIDGTGNLVKDCNIWRDKYRELKAKFDELAEGTCRLVADCDAWREKYHTLISENQTLEASNKQMEAEMERVRTANRSLNELNDKRLAQIRNLKSRGFWARILNKEC